MSMYKWSQTAASNDDIDSTINFQEGQAPRTINNSARALMAAVAKFRDDLSGNLELGGTSTAYTVTTNQVFSALTDGIFFSARPNATSGATPTLNVDGLGAKAIQGVDGTAIATGALLLDAIYTFTYDSTADAWIVHGRFADTLTSGSNPDLVAIEALAGTTGALRKTAANTWSLDDGTFAAEFVIGDGVNTITTGIKGDIQIPMAATITGATLLADASGSIVVDLWKDTYANYPPTDADSITASAPPTLSGAAKSTDTTLTGWTTSVAAGDTIRVNVDSIATCKRVTLILKMKRFI